MYECFGCVIYVVVWIWVCFGDGVDIDNVIVVVFDYGGK